ncbi:hypothetical protein FBR02_14565 [Anaerolineae bacterium CFX9]|nr:hypothetical protein [Anaerolineae bacterium CFX9]
MAQHEVDIHSAKLVDLPMVRRLAEKGAVLDSEVCYTRETGAVQSHLLSSVLLPQRGLTTLVGRAGKLQVIGQIRVKASDHLAQIVYIAPDLQDQCNTVWLHLIDAMAIEAGRRGAHMLTAEVDEQSPLFATLRHTGFAVYARQEIWRLPAGYPLTARPLPGLLADETDDDQMDIQLLYSNIVPRLVQPITVPSVDSDGIVYRSKGRVMGYIAVSQGKGGIYLMPFLHPDVLGSEAAAILSAVVAYVNRSVRTPVYVCVRRYQDWLAESAAELGFERMTQQAVLVRHIAAGVRQTLFARLTTPALEVAAARPPTSNISPADRGS